MALGLSKQGAGGKNPSVVDEYLDGRKLSRNCFGKQTDVIRFSQIGDVAKNGRTWVKLMPFCPQAIEVVGRAGANREVVPFAKESVGDSEADALSSTGNYDG